MPISGGLTIKCRNGKEEKSLGRPDILIAELERYYNADDAHIFSRNRESLEWYLSLFQKEGIEGYCRKIYLIDDSEMLSRFIKSANEPVCDSESAREYMNLALDYWKMKKEKLAEFGIEEK